jgi:ribosomal protein S18 acetylase RimI-like enzyme
MVWWTLSVTPPELDKVELYQRRGLGKAMVTAGLQGLKERGVSIAQLSTGSNNIPMQRLAKSLGFTRTSEKLWFSKEVA